MRTAVYPGSFDPIGIAGSVGENLMKTIGTEVGKEGIGHNSRKQSIERGRLAR